MRRIIVVIFRFTVLQIVKCALLRKEGRKQKFTSTKLLKPRAAAHEEDPSLIAHNGGCGLCAAFISLGWFDCHDPLAIFIRITYVWSLTNSETPRLPRISFLSSCLSSAPASHAVKKTNPLSFFLLTVTKSLSSIRRGGPKSIEFVDSYFCPSCQTSIILENNRM